MTTIGQPEHSLRRRRYGTTCAGGLVCACAIATAALVLSGASAEESTATFVYHLVAGASPRTAIASGSGCAYVGCHRSVLRIELGRPGGTSEAAVGGKAEYLTLDSSRGLIIVTNGDDGIVRTVLTPQMAPCRTVRVGKGLGQTLVSTDASEYYLCDVRSSKILVVSAENWQPVADLQTPGPPLCLRPVGDGRQCVLVCGNPGQGREDDTQAHCAVMIADMQERRLYGEARIPGAEVVDLVPAPVEGSFLAVTRRPVALYMVRVQDDHTSVAPVATDPPLGHATSEAFGVATAGDAVFISCRGLGWAEQVVELNLASGHWRHILALGAGRMCAVTRAENTTDLVIPGAVTDTVSIMRLGRRE